MDRLAEIHTQAFESDGPGAAHPRIDAHPGDRPDPHRPLVEGIVGVDLRAPVRPRSEIAERVRDSRNRHAAGEKHASATEDPPNPDAPSRPNAAPTPLVRPARRDPTAGLPPAGRRTYRQLQTGVAQAQGGSIAPPPRRPPAPARRTRPSGGGRRSTPKSRRCRSCERLLRPVRRPRRRGSPPDRNRPGRPGPARRPPAPLPSTRRPPHVKPDRRDELPDQEFDDFVTHAAPPPRAAAHHVPPSLRQCAHESLFPPPAGRPPGCLRRQPPDHATHPSANGD